MEREDMVKAMATAIRHIIEDYEDRGVTKISINEAKRAIAEYNEARY